MDLRQFFEGFFRLNEELSSFFEQSMFGSDAGTFFEEKEGSGGVQAQGQQSPRDMMLKKRRPERPGFEHHQQLQPSYSPNSDHRPGEPPGSSLMDLLDSGQNFFRSSQFEKTLFSGDLSGSSRSHFEETIVIRNGDGTEKVITKHSSGGRTSQREVTRRGGQIIAESEVVSDDNLGKLPSPFKIDDGGSFKSPDDSNGGRRQSWSSSIWSWFK